MLCVGSVLLGGVVLRLASSLRPVVLIALGHCLLIDVVDHLEEGLVDI